MTTEHPTVALARENIRYWHEKHSPAIEIKPQEILIAEHLLLLQAVADAARDRINSHGRYGECLCSLCAAFHKLDGAPGQGVG
jgi:hypothetical protein